LVTRNTDFTAVSDLPASWLHLRKTKNADENIEQRDCGRLSYAAALCNGAAKRKREGVWTKQQSGSGHTEADAARTPLRLAKSKHNPHRM